MGIVDRVRAYRERRDANSLAEHAALNRSGSLSSEAAARLETNAAPMVAVADAGPAGSGDQWTIIPAGSVLYQFARLEEASSLSWDDDFSLSFRSAAVLASSDTGYPEDGVVNAYRLAEDVELRLISSDDPVPPEGEYVRNAGSKAFEFDEVRLPRPDLLAYVGTFDPSGNQTTPPSPPWGVDDGQVNALTAACR